MIPPQQVVESAVERYLVLHESGEAPELDQYCASLPADVREPVRSGCREALQMKALLGAAGAGDEEPFDPERLGDYRLVREIGRGGMGLVYEAQQISLQRTVALKVLPPHLTLSRTRIERFRREAQAAAKLQHPGIVPILGVGEVRDVHFFAMELVEGESLQDRLERWRAEPEGARDFREALEIVAQLADALQYAHDHGVIHRDVKPQNVLLGKAGVPRLVDFGLAKVMGEESMSLSGELVGTPYYMSPEQALAKRVPIDARTDVFSAGVLLYELLTLHRPFEGRTPQEVLFQITFKEPRPLRSHDARIPRDLQVVCSKAMDKNPQHRYGSAGELAADLRRFLAHEAILARPPSPPQRLLRFARRNRVAVVAALVVVLASTLAFVLAGRFSAAAHRDRALAPLRALAAADDLAQRPVDELRTTLQSVRRVRASFANLGADDAALLGRLERAIQGVGGALAERGQAQLDAGSASRSDYEYVSGWLRLREASQLLPDDADVAARSHWSRLLPHLTVEVPAGAEGPVEVSLLPIDVMTGRGLAPVELGPAPVEDHPLPPGYYRVVVRGAGGHAEATRTLERRGETLVVTPRLRPTEEVVADMVRIEGGPFRFGHGTRESEGPLFAERTEEVEPFWIDAHEVSNAQYRAFCDSTGRAYPIFWTAPYDPAWDDLPVMGVSFHDALAYAEWRGKRLPTLFEWERAARGLDGRAVPWSGGAVTDDEVRARAVVDRGKISDVAQDRVTRAFQHYLQHVQPVDSIPAGATPEGVHHLLGNVHEWTETTYVDTVAGEVTALRSFRVVKGPSYESGTGYFTVTPAFQFMAGWHNLTDVGFRCAKSVNP